LAQASDFLRRKKSRGASTPMKLNNFAPRIEKFGHLGHFLLEIIDIVLALAVIGSDNGRATAKPAERLTEWNMEVQRKVALCPVICQNALRQFRPGEGIS